MRRIREHRNTRSRRGNDRSDRLLQRAWRNVLRTDSPAPLEIVLRNRRWRLHGGHGSDNLSGDSALPPTATRDVETARLEAVLFLSRGPQNLRKLAQLADLPDATKARTLIGRLNRLYDREATAFRVERIAGGYQLLTRMELAPWLRRLHGMSIEVRLSPPAMETLAVIALRQPILRADVEAIRGVACGEIIRHLIDRDLIRIAGRADVIGRPFFYETTRRFLEVFGLSGLEQLPEMGLGPAMERVEESPGETTSDSAAANCMNSEEINFFPPGDISDTAGDENNLHDTSTGVSTLLDTDEEDKVKATLIGHQHQANDEELRKVYASMANRHGETVAFGPEGDEEDLDADELEDEEDDELEDDELDDDEFDDEFDDDLDEEDEELDDTWEEVSDDWEEDDEWEEEDDDEWDDAWEEEEE